MKRTLIAICCALTSVPCFSGDWIPAAAYDGVFMLVDGTLLNTDDAIKGTWVLSVTEPSDKFSGYALTWWECDCKAYKARSSDFNSFSFEGDHLTTNKTVTKWTRGVPGSVTGDIINIICSRPKEKGIDSDSPKEVAQFIRDYLVSEGKWK